MLTLSIDFKIRFESYSFILGAQWFFQVELDKYGKFNFAYLELNTPNGWGLHLKIWQAKWTLPVILCFAFLTRRSYKMVIILRIFS